MYEIVFHLGTFADTDGPFPGLVVSEQVTDLRPYLGEVTVLSLLQDWDASTEALGQIASERPAGVDVGSLRVLPPVHPPGTYFCAGGNYRRHVVEMLVAQRDTGTSTQEAHDRAHRSIDERAASGIPYAFVGLPNAVCGAYDDVVLPPQGTQHDWEVELTVVIGKTARAVVKEEAMDYVAGYTIGNDISARDRMFRTDVTLTDFLATKLRPTFKPIGPYITPAQFVPDPQSLQITLTLNGQVMQDDSTSDMIFGVDRLIEYLSGLTDLNPGDMIMTGSPAGNAAHHGNRFLQPGDVMQAEISGLGIQRIRCVEASTVAKGPDDSVVYTPMFQGGH